MTTKSLKPEWKIYKFEDFVENIREQVMPKPEDSRNYIGLEHLDSGSIHVRRWGTDIELKGTKFRMKKNDLLFARRNAYLRRVAIAPHDGLFSAHGMILRPKKQIVFPEFLPFFLQSDVFMDRAVKISVGSMSPTINWSTLRLEEFALPPLNEQKRIADLLWSIDEVVERKIILSRQLNGFYCSFLEEIYSEQRGKKKYKVKDICTINANNLSAKTDPNYRFKYLDITSIIAPNKIGELKEYSFEDAPSRARRIVEQGNLVLSLVRPYHQSFVIVENEIHNLIASTGTAVLKAGDSVDTKYLFHSLFTKKFLSFCEQRMNGTNYPAITPNDLKQYEVYLPALDEQRVFSKKLSAIKEIEEGLLKEIEMLNGINKQLINQIFG